jgi:hypothetical protein
VPQLHHLGEILARRISRVVFDFDADAASNVVRHVDNSAARITVHMKGPLFVVGYCSTTTPEILEYFKDMYQVLGKTMKIEQVLVLKDMLGSFPLSI